MTATPLLVRRITAEVVGSAFLVMGVVGSGIAAARLSPDDAGLQLLENSTATGAVLLALILALQPVSASFNPIVTLVESALGLVRARDAALLSVGQVGGASLGCVLANLMFDLAPVTLGTHHRATGATMLAEAVATLGLVVLVFASLRSGRTEQVALVVAAYIAAAYWFTSSTSFANPAVTIGRMLTDTFAGIAPASVPGFVLMEGIGGLLGYLLVRVLYPATTLESSVEGATS